MTVLKKNINLHPFTAPSADTNTAAPESNGAGGKKGGETLKLPSYDIFDLFDQLVCCYRALVVGEGTDFDFSLFDPELNPFAWTPSVLNDEYPQFLGLLKVLESLDDEEKQETLLSAIQEKAYDVAECIADEYPVLQPFFEKYVTDSDDEE